MQRSARIRDPLRDSVPWAQVPGAVHADVVGVFSVGPSVLFSVGVLKVEAGAGHVLEDHEFYVQCRCSAVYGFVW